METHLLTPDSQEWDAWIGRARHDFYHLSRYHLFAQDMGEGDAFLAVCGTPDRFLAWPYLRRTVEGNHADATSVYGYPGPVGCGLDDDAFLQSAWAALKGIWAEQNIVALFTRFHPIIANESPCRRLYATEVPEGGEVFHLGRSISIDLTLDTDARRALYPQPLRQDVKKAERHGMSIEVDENWNAYAEFISFYRATMSRNEANRRYDFSDAYFEGLRRSLDGVAHLSVAKMEDEIAAALVFTVCDGLAAAHLTGINAKFGKLSPLKCLLDRTAEIAGEMGAQRLHLGAGRGGDEDTLFAFKSRFSPDRHDFYLGRWIFDADAYRSLTAARHGSDTPPADFFPASRAPRQSGERVEAAE